ncbi:YeiH family protein [Actinoalloteichus fjordicus]|uniref:YeiH family protein n=1 Tax=Actinoalloteichus fjordicus TaxID=1612552 RepID=UPI00384E3A7D
MGTAASACNRGAVTETTRPVAGGPHPTGSDAERPSADRPTADAEACGESTVGVSTAAGDPSSDACDIGAPPTDPRPSTVAASSSRLAPARLVPGLVVVAVAVGLAAVLHAAIPSVGLVTAALLLGVLAGNLPLLPAAASVGVTWATRRLLRAGVVLLGLGLSIPQLLGVGPGVLLAVLLTVAGTFVVTVWLGRLLGLSRGLSLCVGTGFAVCGASAVAAVEGVIRREERDVVTAIALVTLYGSLAVAALPLAGGALGLDEQHLGRWIGLSVHEVAQVVAAAAPAGEEAVTSAVVVKLSRVVLLAPLIAAISVVERRRRPTTGTRPPLIPLFVAGFLASVALRSSGLLPDVVLAQAATLTTVLLAAALFGLGTTVRLAALRRTGPRALLLGLASTLVVTGLAWSTLWALG